MRTVLAWSTGKDCAWALHVLRRTPGIDVVGLLTILDEATDRVAMHGTTRALLTAQAAAAQVPLTVVPLPWPCSNEIYETRMAAAVEGMRAARVEAVAFGDLFLADIRAYRERQLEGTGLSALFPLWGRDTTELASEMIAGGLEARIACLDPQRVPRHLVGRTFDAATLSALPPGVDPCGENGEFHTLATGGPMFARRVPVTGGDPRERDGFVYADLDLG